jgi:hypothetical protein
MKCLICGGKTPTGAKLCLPCRAALRRARDDTISELLPLPRRRDALAYAQSTSVAGALPLRGATVVERRPRCATTRRSSVLRWVTPAHFRNAAIASFVVAAGLLAFIAIHELQRDRAAVATAVEGVAIASPADARTVVPRVSPSTLLGTARNENPPIPAVDSVSEARAEAPPVPAAVPERRIEKPARARAGGRAIAAAEAAPIAAVEPPLEIIRAPAPAAPPVARVVAPDGGQLLAASLAKCVGANFFSRTVCEHRSRSQYCDGLWGQHPLCAASVSNDHGQ